MARVNPKREAGSGLAGADLTRAVENAASIGRAVRRLARNHSLEPAELEILLALSLRGELTHGALREQLHVGGAAITRALRQLRDARLIADSTVADDARKRPHRLTAKG